VKLLSYPVLPQNPKLHWVLEGSQASPVSPSGKSNMCRWEWSTSGMILTRENQCTGRRQGTLSQRHPVHHKSHIHWPEIEPRPPWLEAGNCLIRGTAYKRPHLIGAINKTWGRTLHIKHHISRVRLFIYWCSG